MSRSDVVRAHDAVEVLAAVARSTGGRACALVGIDGPSGSGKSTLARALAELAGAPLVEVDEFWTWGDSDEWWAYFVESVLMPIAAGGDAHHRLRDWQADPPGRPSGPWVTTPCAPLVLVEGITCTRRSVAHLYAARIWVDAQESLRLERGLVRDGVEHLHAWREWMATEAVFFAADGTADRADVRLGHTVGGG